MYMVNRTVKGSVTKPFSLLLYNIYKKICVCVCVCVGCYASFYLFIWQRQCTLISITANVLELAKRLFFIHCPWTDVNIIYLKKKQQLKLYKENTKYKNNKTI